MRVIGVGSPMFNFLGIIDTPELALDKDFEEWRVQFSTRSNRYPCENEIF